jgi:hypothetical protein
VDTDHQVDLALPSFLPSIFELAEEHLWGLTRGRIEREKVAILGLARGETRRTMAIRLGMGVSALEGYIARDGELREAVEFAEAIAIQPLEAELRSRALAGAEDKGSIRALEISLKKLDPAYRDNQQIQLTLVQGAARAQSSVQDRWQPRDVTPPGS